MTKVKSVDNGSGLKLLRVLYVLGSFFLVDLWLRYVTRKIGLYDLTELAPNLFTLCWSVILTALVTAIPSRLAGRITYGVLYFLSAIFAIVQDIYFQIFEKFLYFNDIMYAGEAGDFIGIVLQVVDFRFLIHILALVAVGVVGIILFPQKGGKASLAVKAGAVALSIVGILLAPKLYGEYDDSNWNSFNMPAFEYENFVNSDYDMQLMGYYQYLAKNTVLLMEQNGIIGAKARQEQRQQVDDFFAERPAHSENEMTGLFAGKNVIVVMMESLDDWLINETDTPALYYMMTHGINFENFYTPQYSSGYTFNTEFAFNTGVYPYTNSNAAYALANNDFSESLAHKFADAGYRVNSYHRSKADYYNRGVMHRAFGYEDYHSYFDYPGADVTRENDLYLTRCDELYEDVVSGEPFMSFVITYSPHLPYDDTDRTSLDAVELHPEYDLGDPVSVLRAKTRLTDDMFAELLQRLEKDGILEDTVIVAFTDHYTYGLLDQQLVYEKSVEYGNSIVQNTPCFIYCAGMEESMTVTKGMQTTDLSPTIANLFGLDVPEKVMGRDVFDENYMGYALFPNHTWVSEFAYIWGGMVDTNNGLTEEEITRMNQLAQRSYVINDAILDSDYYRSAE